MNQTERRKYLINRLIDEQPRFRNIEIPSETVEQKRLLRSLFNIRPPKQADREFLRVQDEYLTEELAQKGITDSASLTPIHGDFYLWQGDITTLKCDAIVNAANSGLTGCYQPCHACIDNAIHTFSGVQLREICGRIMEKQGCEEPTGQAKITPAFNLPCRFVLHTVGPIVSGRLTEEHCELLKSCYRSCLELAEDNGVDSIAFCCISTGVFCFPNDIAAEIAVDTAEAFKREKNSDIKVIFNVFKDSDLEIYKNIFNKRIEVSG